MLTINQYKWVLCTSHYALKAEEELEKMLRYEASKNLVSKASILLTI